MDSSPTENFHVSFWPRPNASSMSLADVATACARQNLLISPCFSPSGTLKAWLDKHIAWRLMPRDSWVQILPVSTSQLGPPPSSGLVRVWDSIASMCIWLMVGLAFSGFVPRHEVQWSGTSNGIISSRLLFRSSVWHWAWDTWTSSYLFSNLRPVLSGYQVLMIHTYEIVRYIFLLYSVLYY